MQRKASLTGTTVVLLVVISSLECLSYSSGQSTKHFCAVQTYNFQKILVEFAFSDGTKKLSGPWTNSNTNDSHN